MANIKLSPLVHDILERSIITETTVTLPAGQLERKQYEEVKKALEAAGGKWNRSAQGFVFTKNPKQVLGFAMVAGVIIDKKKERQAFYTPTYVADFVAELADVPGYTVLEPQAGDGALAEACMRWGAKDVFCVEIDEEEAESCRKKGFTTWTEDFLDFEVGMRYSRIVMNPPFSKGQDVKHIKRALKWLKPGGKLFAIVPNKDNPKLDALGAVQVRHFDSGAFKESGTQIATRLISIEP